MYLKSLELHGFKSFPNRTTLLFERGATVIIGPNGSGKSNISDAMRWVLGEMSTKNIRGTKMEDVIFGGTDTRRPMGFAEVTVTFDNTEEEGKVDSPYSEISVTRRYYRNGDSEYMLNKKTCRLRDIHELFMNTGIGRDGYSIIGQGKIAEILSKKSEDRRSIFEEAAGIAKFCHHKDESERKLSDCENNMLRVSDILSVLSERVGPLEKEAEKAKKYLDLYDQKKNTDIALWLYDIEKMSRDEEEAAKALELSRHELEMADETGKQLERRYEKLFEESQKTKAEAERLYLLIKQATEEKHREEQAEKLAESQASHIRTLIELQENSDKSKEKELSDNASRLFDIRKEGVELREKLSEAEEELARIYERQRACEERISFSNAQLSERLEEINSLERELSDISVRLGVLKGAVNSGEGEREKLMADLDALTAEKEIYTNKAEKAFSAVSKYEDRIAETDKSISLCEPELEKLASELDRLSAMEVALIAKRDSAKERAEALRRMEEHFEGYSFAVKKIMQDYKRGAVEGAGEIYGPLTQLISSEPKYATAIETALGANIQNIACDDDRTAKKSIYHLKNTGGGRATFCPVSSMHPQEPTAEMEQCRASLGYIGTADSLVIADKKFSGIIGRLIGRTLVFDSLENATEAAREAKFFVKIVTLDGQVVNPGGSFTGGSVVANGGIMTRSSQIKQLEKDAEEKTRLLSELAKEKADILKKKDEISAGADNKRAERDMLLALCGAERSALEAAKAKEESLSSMADKLSADIERLSQRKQTAGEEISAMEGSVSELKGAIAEKNSKREDIYRERGEESEELEKLKKQENDAHISVAEIKRDILNAEERCAECEKREAAIASELDISKEKQEEYKARYEAQLEAKAAAEKRAAVLAENIDTLDKTRAGLDLDNREKEQKQNELHNRIKDKNAERDVIFRAHTKNEETVSRLLETREKLTESLREEYQLTYSQAKDAVLERVTEESRAEFGQRQTKLKNQLRALGQVNVNAIDEYAEAKERFDMLSSQMEDLTKSKAQLLDAIASVEGEMRRRFTETFHTVNKNFGEVFSELFGGGHAELLLTDPEDVLTSGIDIKAAPPGKIVKSLSLLSGGEQAFVAIALLFAVLRVNPSPFCIFDEIESALDEVNVSRFADYVKAFSGGTQFILITHRRGTMEAADRMYGVTMPERGTSKVIPLNIGEFDFSGGEYN